MTLEAILLYALVETILFLLVHQFGDNGTLRAREFVKFWRVINYSIHDFSGARSEHCRLYIIVVTCHNIYILNG